MANLTRVGGKKQFDVGQHAVSLNEAVYRSLIEFAKQEHRSIQEVASEILSQAIQERHKSGITQARWRELSRREQEAVALYCLGFTGDEICKRFTLSINTVKTHLRNGMQKLGLSSRSELKRALADWDFSSWLETTHEPAKDYLQSPLPLPGFTNGRKRKIP